MITCLGRLSYLMPGDRWCKWTYLDGGVGLKDQRCTDLVFWLRIILWFESRRWTYPQPLLQCASVGGFNTVFPSPFCISKSPISLVYEHQLALTASSTMGLCSFYFRYSWASQCFCFTLVLEQEGGGKREPCMCNAVLWALTHRGSSLLCECRRSPKALLKKNHHLQPKQPPPAKKFRIAEYMEKSRGQRPPSQQ